MSGETRALADVIATGTTPPDDVMHEGTRAILNWLGCALGGAEHPAVTATLAAFLPFAGPPASTLIGRNERTDPLLASLANGIAGHVLDFDDTHPDTFIHPAGPVLPALLALSETRRVSGHALLTAFIYGVEAEIRIGEAVYPAHYDVGWHITGTVGVFGAAAACARLLGLDATRTAEALGIAGTQAAGLRETFGSMAKSLHPGRAAQAGLGAALLAEQGFTAGTTILEGRRGFTQVMATSRDLTRLTDGLGERWAIRRNTYKPFACGLVVHPAIDACLQLRAEGIAPEMIARLHLTVAPMALELTGRRTPTTGLEGKFSVYHAAAAALIRGRGGEAEFSDACVRDPRVIALRDRITATADPTIADHAVIAAATLRNGQIVTRRIDHVLGSLARPLDDHGLAEKFRGLAGPSERTERLIALCRGIAGLDDAATLVRETRR